MKLRPVWHPLVHEQYREQLRFVGLRIYNYGEALTYMKNGFDETISIYEVFGDRDIIARIYGSEANYGRVCELLAANVGTITADFFVGEILWLWGFPVPWSSADPCRCGRGRSVLAEFEASDLEEAAEDWEGYPDAKKARLLESGLVIGEASDPSGREAIRAFVLVGSGFTKTDWLKDIISRLQRRIEPLGRFLHGLYLGRGTGFDGNILIELNVPNENYEEIIAIIREAHDELHFTEPSTKTYIAGDITKEHVDRCSFAATPEQEVERAKRRFPAATALPLDEQISITNLSRHWNKWLGLPQTQGHARAIIDATIDELAGRGLEKLKHAVAALGDSVERYLRDHLAELAEHVWGAKEWEQGVKSDLTMEKPISGWTLGDIVEAFRRWRGIDESIITSNALNRLLDFLDLRNAAVHPVRKKDRRIFDDYGNATIHAITESIFDLLTTLKQPSSAQDPEPEQHGGTDTD